MNTEEVDLETEDQIEDIEIELEDLEKKKLQLEAKLSELKGEKPVMQEKQISQHIATEGVACGTIAIQAGILEEVLYKSAGVAITNKGPDPFFFQMGYDEDADAATMLGYRLDAEEREKLYMGFHGNYNRLTISSSTAGTVGLIFFAYLDRTE